LAGRESPEERDVDANNSSGVGLVNIQDLIDDASCFEKVRQLRWPDGVRCPFCGGEHCIKHGFDETQEHRQRYGCKSCGRYFDDLTGTVFEGHHQPLRVWILCLYFMGLNLSNAQIAKELDLHKDDVQNMTRQLREGVLERKPETRLQETVECDEVYVVAGHKGHPAAVKKNVVRDAETASKAHAGAVRSKKRSRRSSA
jgi:transposase-like protein